MSEIKDESTIFIPITGKQLSLAIVALLTAIGSYPVASWLTPDVRNDPFTGTQGDAHDRRIESLELYRAEHEDYSTEIVQTLFIKLENHDVRIGSQYRLISECMKRTGQ